jgi:hypothetical protein
MVCTESYVPADCPSRGARSGDRYGGSRHPPSAQELVSRRQDGFKAHLAAEPDTGIITDCALTRLPGPTTTRRRSGLSYWSARMSR